MPKIVHSEKLDAKSEDLPIEQFLTYQLLLLTNRLNRQAMHILEEQASLRLPEWRCLAFIQQCSRDRNKISLHELADTIGMDRALVSRSVQGLVEKGHVLTERDARDRRVVFATLSGQGRALYRQMLPIMQKRQMHLLEALSPQDRKAIYRIMNRLNGAVAEWEESQINDAKESDRHRL